MRAALKNDKSTRKCKTCKAVKKHDKFKRRCRDCVAASETKVKVSRPAKKAKVSPSTKKANAARAAKGKVPAAATGAMAAKVVPLASEKKEMRRPKCCLLWRQRLSRRGSQAADRCGDGVDTGISGRL
jgi:hypothetical protein